MAKKFLPCFEIKVSTKGLEALSTLLYIRLTEHKDMLGSLSVNNVDSIIKILISQSIILGWQKQTDRQTVKDSLKIKLDMAQALAFYAYWKNENVPAYEAVTLNKIISAIDQYLVNKPYQIIK